MKSEFEIAITQLSADRSLAPEVILEAIEAALVSAYKRHYGATQAVRVTIDTHTGQSQVFVAKRVVPVVEDEHQEISLEQGRVLDPTVELEGTVEVEVKPRDFGRIAAQTAKQVITQRIREAERDSVYLEFQDREGEIVTGIVRNVDSRSRNVILGLGKAEALLSRNEQISGERYRFNQRLRVYIVSVERSGHGPQIIVSRSHPELLRRLFELEVPEIYNGTVEVKAISREPGARSKVAVAALQAGVDPVGSCVGMRGVRIQNIVNELNGEKIDVVEWDADLETYIGNSLSPAKALSVYLFPQDGTASVVVPDRALSLAIGKEGQNARLAAKLTGWRIDIKSETEAAAEAEAMAAKMAEQQRVKAELEAARLAAAALLAEAEASLAEEEGEGAESEELAAEAEAPESQVLVDEVAAQPDEEIDEAEAEEELELAPVAEADVPIEEFVPALDDLGGWDEAALAEEESLPDEAVEAVAEDTQTPAEDLPIEDLMEEEEPELEELLEGEDEPSAEERRRKNRGRTLEFDERLGRVVARKRHRRAGQRTWQDWELDADVGEDEDDE